ncbi:Gfo/Idh/MocA family protein [Haladaptatus pallidirubidus]|uniref:Gfo/Idh/MocA family oxidoreductase n=1 Tax=Haladaptatus pallidirubidus TaxID=1008152 RepID=A0AAV3UJ23_9EURY|nr:Gfo/Idh/MocA family oxidoreductase [Haladaptatus pallidirubidus]
MTENYRIAIAGIGAVAEMHVESITDLSNAELVGGSCRTIEKGRAFADEFDCTHYTDTETLLEEMHPDVLIVCTPSGAHLEPTLAAADHGVHVLCEKPLEITTERIDDMIEACETAGVRLGGVFPQRYNPVVETMHDAAESGRFGRLAVANAYVPWWRPNDYYEGSWQGTVELDGGGAIMNQSIHSVDAIQWLAGATMDLDEDVNPVAEVFAYTDTLAHNGDLMEVEDTAATVFRFRNKTLGQLLGTTSMYPGSLKRIQLAGRDGTAEILEDELVTWQFREEHSNDTAVREEFTETARGGGASDPMSIDYEYHRRNIAAYLDALANEEPFMLDGQEARKAVEIIEAVYASADRRKPVRLG